MEFATLFWVGMGFGAVVLILHYLTSVQVDYGPMRYQRWHAAFVMSRERRAARRSGMVQDRADSWRSNPEPEPEPLPNAATERRTDTGTGAFVLNPDQQLAVTRMIYHKTGNPSATKATTIKVGFGVSKGESSRYKEASAIYDALFVLREPERFPHMTEEQRSLRKELRLPVR
jgi:hypothetical protein